MLVNVEQKKEFVQWLTHSVNFNRREVYWILNYLIDHKAILNQVIFVEHAHKTPRGLKITGETTTQAPLELYLSKRTFTDPEQIFHELRMNWKKELYLEVSFAASQNNPLYLAVLEDNPFYTWNDQVDQSFATNLDKALKQAEREYQRQVLQQQIDHALESGNREAFELLSSQLKREQLNDN